MKMLLKSIPAAMLAVSLNAAAGPVEHVLMISVDGLHALDLLNYSSTHPESALAHLAANGIEFSGTHTPPPSDSFPGLLALTTGGSPGVTGVYYDETYSRKLSPPGSDCKHTGTEVIYDESVDDPKAALGEPKLDESKLPRDPEGCKPVYPHTYLRVNTIFEVVKKAGGHTAWIDKHPVYEIIDGPSGTGVDDLYTPEIGSNFEGSHDRHVDKITASIAATERYDASKIDALINEINGFKHDGKTAAPVPVVFGLNMQEVNVAEKLSGYRNEAGVPTGRLESAIANSDRLIGNVVSALQRKKLLASTLIIITAKHGNGPIDPRKIRHVDAKALEKTVDAVLPAAIARITSDQGALVWLTDPGKTKQVAHVFETHRRRLGISNVLYGNALALEFPSPRTDSRTPDIMLVAEPGTIYAKAGDRKKAEHGGFSEDDTHVALLISNPSISAKIVRSPVSTTQVAPTILASLGLPPDSLQAVRTEGTQILPGLDWKTLAGKF